jgi:hypothetical protein
MKAINVMRNKLAACFMGILSENQLAVKQDILLPMISKSAAERKITKMFSSSLIIGDYMRNTSQFCLWGNRIFR